MTVETASDWLMAHSLYEKNKIKTIYYSCEVFLHSLVVQYGLKRNPLAWFPANFVYFGFQLLFVLRTNGIIPTILNNLNH